MADETRTPEEVAREWLSGESIPLPPGDMEELTLGLADLIREERKVAFAAGTDAGQQAERAEQPLAKVLVFLAGRERLAVEGRSDG